MLIETSIHNRIQTKTNKIPRELKTKRQMFDPLTWGKLQGYRSCRSARWDPTPISFFGSLEVLRCVVQASTGWGGFGEGLLGRLQKLIVLGDFFGVEKWWSHDSHDVMSFSWVFRRSGAKGMFFSTNRVLILLEWSLRLAKQLGNWIWFAENIGVI